MRFYIGRVSTLVQMFSYKFFSFPQHPGVSVVERQQAWYFGILLHLDKLLCSAVVFHLLHQKWQVRVISLGMCPTTAKQLFSCIATAYLLCLLYFSQNASNDSSMQGLHMCLYTWWLRTLHLTMNWLLGVAVVLGPSAMFTFVDFTALLSEMALHLLWLHCCHRQLCQN